MDTLRYKLYLLKNETTEVLTRLLTVEKSKEDATTFATNDEKKIRTLQKAVSKKDHDHDVMQDKLEATEKKIKVTETDIRRNLEDAVALKDLTQVKEAELRKFANEEAEAVKNLSEVGSRTEASEKKSKELEHLCNNVEAQIDKIERDLEVAKKTTVDACEKYEETAKKLNGKETFLNKNETKAKTSVDKGETLEKELMDMVKKMGAKEKASEDSLKRENTLKIKLGQLSRMLAEAEHRAEMKELEQAKLETLLSQLKNDQEEMAKKMDKVCK